MADDQPMGLGQVGDDPTASTAAEPLSSQSTASFVLRLPFKLPPRREIKEGPLLIDGRSAELVVHDSWHVLTIRGLESEAAAKQLLPRVAAALMWVAVDSPDGLEVSSELQDLQLDQPPPPDAVLMNADGVGDEGRPSIYPEGKSVIYVSAGSAIVRSRVQLATFEERLGDGLANADLSTVLQNDIVSLAVELFTSSYFFTDAPYAQFLLRMSVLEVLSQPSGRAEPVQLAIEACRREIRELKARHEIEASEAQSTDSGLVWLLRDSIGQAIGRLVRDLLGDGAARDVRDLYTMRSNMLHEGLLPESGQLHESLRRLTVIVQHVLRGQLTTAEHRPRGALPLDD